MKFSVRKFMLLQNSQVELSEVMSPQIKSQWIYYVCTQLKK